jgi:hypothetical protein
MVIGDGVLFLFFFLQGGFFLLGRFIPFQGGLLGLDQ